MARATKLALACLLAAAPQATASACVAEGSEGSDGACPVEADDPALLQMHGGAEVTARAKAAHEVAAAAQAAAAWGPGFRATQAPSAPGYFEAIYSYGAPGTAVSALQDKRRKNGCFRGLRTYTEDIWGLFRESKYIDEVALGHVPWTHAKVGTLALHWDDDSFYKPCPEPEVDWPIRGAAVYPKKDLSKLHHYWDRLGALKLEGSKGSVPAAQMPVFKEARDVEALVSYWSDNSEMKEGNALLAKELPGWKMVASAVRGYLSERERDIAGVFQDASDLSCVLTLTGRFVHAGWWVSYAYDASSEPFCNITGVRSPFAREVRQLGKKFWSFLGQTLGKCSSVTCAGSNSGGSLCEVVAACVNSGATTDPDYQLLAWDRAEPVKLQYVVDGKETLYSEDS